MRWRSKKVRFVGENERSDTVRVLFLGRNNRALDCPAVDAVKAAFVRRGVSVDDFCNPYERSCLELDCWLQRLLPASLADFCFSRRRTARILRTLLRLMLAMILWRQRAFICTKIFGVRRVNQWALRQILSRHSPHSVILLAHSAGGILAAAVEAHPAVRSAVCFGYPFRHPAKREQRYRTCNLANIAKPFLIVQGNRDPYGTVAAARRYSLSPEVVLLEVAADHEYRLDWVQGASISATVTEFALGGQLTEVIAASA